MSLGTRWKKVISANATSWLCSNGSHSVGSTSGTYWSCFNVITGADQCRHGDGVTGALAVLQRVLILGRRNLAEVINTSLGLRRFADFVKSRNCHRGQETDDDDYDHDFNERETFFGFFENVHNIHSG